MDNRHLRLVEPEQVGVIPGLRIPSSTFGGGNPESYNGSELHNVAAVVDYQPSQQQADVISCSRDINERVAQLPGSLYFWEHEQATLPFVRNRFDLLSTGLDEPKIVNDGFNSTLSIAPRFEFSYETRHFAAEVAEIRLVVSERFITLENDEKIFLVATTEKPVLYLTSFVEDTRNYTADPSPDDQHSMAVFQHCTNAQPKGKTQQYSFTDNVQQVIPATFKGYKVTSMTVLEHFHSYFMQRPLMSLKNDAGLSDAIWVPLLPPLSWGWSMRVAPIIHNEWAIVRRKLMLPISSEEGTHFPEWSSNIRNNCTAAKFSVFAI